MSKDAYYFPHDSNAKDDPKIVLLIEQFGLEGYGIYWILIETLRDQPDYRYPLKLLPALARRYITTKEKMEAVVNGYGLFKLENGEFFLSQSLCRRMAHFDAKKRRLSEAGKRGRAKQLQAPMGKAQATPGQPPGIKVNKSKVKERKINKRNEPVGFDVFAFRPQWISVEDWADLVTHRRKRKAAETERAYKSIVEEFCKAGKNGFSAGDCISKICNRNWTGFEAEWMRADDSRNASGRKTQEPSQWY